MTRDSKQSDRELLELAAKAAGIDLYIADNFGRLLPMRKDASHEGEPWDPLTDDGYALRLAVKLAMKIEINYGERSFHAWAEAFGSTHGQSVVGADPYTATRRAIVRAAAEIGMGK